ncbi:bifunctional sugar phosphate isomerase/epimerase/4-hydroxyphenylpyruvate dioxygenase family protein [Pseudooceanicola sp. HF7]|uniref:bifunctional sugar phosphate isomerase/epimerase/4-hydroxyphenylpyruvate dioxygenase family protein n=1 Tax=Pseudooceanicola sp. HF7 TaxID=2721560 RepID=UPI001430671B|nr:sugar phosphate isomerase/epimerase and 4-hydroxyphenylpyruvate domain-containing protein [Pseudooceanicola sp. HF7]NIZ10912.1 sugar phosphate isomerase/epimerase and 4-hydroxyphenylpyruvate domain-containing protein [Pseudooceanicola sp. HF7]
MKTAIATVSISGTLTEKLEAIAAAGFDGIEIFEQDFITDIGSARDVGNRIRDQGLEISLFQPFRDFEGLPEELRVKAFDRAERKFDLMQDLGADLVLVCSSVHPKALGGIDRAADDLRELGERAAARGLRIGYEALAWGRHVNDHRDAWEIVRRADHDSVGIILDSFHTLGRGLDPESIRRIPGDKIFFVQMADAPKIDMDLLYWSRHFRNMPGEGDLPVTDFMRAVLAAGYTGPVSLEIFNDQFRGGSPNTIARDGYRSLMALLDDVRRQEPDVPAPLPVMPARQRIDGTSFIEFATRGADGDQLRAQLTALGFAQTGKHMAKAVTLWQQGDIRIVVNEEEGDFAGTAYNMHGTSVCDVGLAVSSASETLERAKALGARGFTQQPALGQLDIPAIRGLGGSLLHVLDDSHASVWTREFGAEPKGPKGAGLQAVDHIAQTLTYDEMLSWSLFYGTLFDMEKSPMVDVIDPDGLVRSQALSTPEGRFRITLNGAETHRTLAGAFLADSFGAPVQHIAFTTEDIFASAEALASAGFDPLPIPGNYYDDLASRFDIPSEKLARMKTLQILYDAEDGQEFFQSYSRPFQGGIFFEIVQRASGYRGYGAPNAPFRIAAQKRLAPAKGMPRI